MIRWPYLETFSPTKSAMSVGIVMISLATAAMGVMAAVTVVPRSGSDNDGATIGAPVIGVVARVSDMDRCAKPTRISQLAFTQQAITMSVGLVEFQRDGAPESPRILSIGYSGNGQDRGEAAGVRRLRVQAPRSGAIRR